MTEPAIPRLRDFNVGDKVHVKADETITYFSSSKTIMRAIEQRLTCVILKKDEKHDVYLVNVPTESSKQPFFKAYICGEELIPALPNPKEKQ